MQRWDSVCAAFVQRPLRTLPTMRTNNDAGRSSASRREFDWRAAFASGDPAMQWAAACSVAQVIAGRDHWVDTTAMHEARVGAYESAVAAVQSDPDSVIAGSSDLGWGCERLAVTGLHG